ncbi:hypothetical protein K458DRAFT_396336 [Lentithecium fluviatile CBS 122367]|uniref:Uncharacterized protein n=1 Tax=Lentithecium fluviatile CBS 122367 TaxID=1168545 RepID=A0A6G1IFR9_9PLEO|nr:hypothetical protein K458DRAFT_396336 [Lentithecium fluviatile CBS 122367]
MADAKTPDALAHRYRSSLHVTYDPKEIPELAKQIVDGTIADVHLSLFTYWINEKPEHYQEAKKYIRELGVDQAYPISRIKNEYVRKLVQETFDMRPKYEYPESSSEEEEESDSVPGLPTEEQESPSNHAASLRFPNRFIPTFSRAKALLRSKSDAQARRASPAMDPKLQHLRNRQTSSPMRPRSPWLKGGGSPLSLSAKKQAAGSTKSSTTSSSLSTLSSSREYPPDTPDRPAPLNIRSRGPDSGSDSGPLTAIHRSFSTPVRDQTVPHFACSPTVSMDSSVHGRRNTSVGEARPASSVYSNPDEKEEPFDIPKRVSGRITSSTETLRHGDYDDLQPRYELEPHEMSESVSNSPMAPSTYPSSEFAGRGEPDTGSVFGGTGTETSMMNNNGFVENLENQPGADDEHDAERDQMDEDGKDDESQLGYALTNPRSGIRSVISKPAPTPSQRREKGQARRRAQLPVVGVMNGFHRPLPLRTYESEAFMFPTARGQSGATHTRANSLTTSLSRGRRPLDSDMDGMEGMDESKRRVIVKAMENLVLGAGRPSNPLVKNSPDEHSPTTTHVPSRRESTESLDLLVQFPEPPTSTAPTDEDLHTAYKSITEAYMKRSLERTRARGALLSIVDADSISSFEAAWRTVNEQLLVAIYGRNDVALTLADIEFVDRIAKELRDGAGQITGYEWVGALFLQR